MFSYLQRHLKFIFIFSILNIVIIGNATADEIRPALLNITERSPAWFEVIWKVPARNNKVLAIKPILPKSFIAIASPSLDKVPGALISRTTYKNDNQPLIGKKIIIDGLSSVQTDVILKIDLLNGVSHSAILQPATPFFIIPENETRITVALSYWRMGAFHILEGTDHLLFLLAILCIVSGFANLLKTVTAFTVAHSVTLSLALLQVVQIPSAPTEAVISLSIVFLATEIIRKYSGASSLTERYPWSIAFIFGLFHGLGFAGALSEIGLPAHDVPLALFAFNMGVETGQIFFITLVVVILTVLRRIPLLQSQRIWRLVPYSIGSIASFWTIQRMISLF